MKLLQNLRAATATHHENLHSHPVLSQLVEHSVSQSYLLRALRKFYGFYEPMERCYGAVSDSSQNAALSALQQAFPAGEIVSRLRNDLGRRGIDLEDVDTMDSSLQSFTLEQSLAYLYLREGSRLGGNVISKNLHRRLSLEAGTDNQFFGGHGIDAGKNWQQFLRTLVELENHVDADQTAAYAAHLFQQLGSWLSQKDNVNVPA